jgi:CubicO group peptidase (beta-lactamase class C family)
MNRTLFVFALLAVSAAAQVTFQRILDAGKESQNWLTYSGDYTGQRFSKQNPRVPPPPPKEFNGGGGLYSTTADYTRFMQMILGKGRGLNGARILQLKTVASMEVNQIGALTAGKMKTMRPEMSSDVEPGSTEKWSLGFLINTTPYAGGRSAGSLAWAGLFNTFYWIDPERQRCAVLMMQFLPFVDKQATGLLGDFERAVYSAV